MKPDLFWCRLSSDEKQAFADALGKSKRYLENVFNNRERGNGKTYRMSIDLALAVQELTLKRSAIDNRYPGVVFVKDSRPDYHKRLKSC